MDWRFWRRDAFLLQLVRGIGTAWIELSGELTMKDLQPGETLRVQTTNLSD